MEVVPQLVRTLSTYDPRCRTFALLWDVGYCLGRGGMYIFGSVRFGMFGLAICTALDRVAIYPFCTSNVGRRQHWLLWSISLIRSLSNSNSQTVPRSDSSTYFRTRPWVSPRPLLFPRITLQSPNILRRNRHILPTLPNRSPFLIPFQRFPHIKRILAILIILLNPPINTIPHLAIQLLCNIVTRAHKQIHKPRIRRIARALERTRQRGCVPETARRRGDGQSGNVAVPREVVWVF
jgi:hypothetical protein